MKVFVTLEREDGDDKKTVDYILGKCVELERNLYEHGIKTQMKITSLPRRTGWTKASELDNIESK